MKSKNHRTVHFSGLILWDMNYILEKNQLKLVDIFLASEHISNTMPANVKIKTYV